MKHNLSLKNATRAIYVDFEGVMDAAPVLLGAHWVDDDGQKHLVQYVFDIRLETAASARTPKKRGECVFVDSIDSAVAEICALAEKEDRLLVEWSKHEERVVRRELTDPGLALRFLARIRDAKDVAKPWKRNHHPHAVFQANDRGQKNCLSNFMRLAGKPYPTRLEGAARQLRHVLKQIEKRGRYKTTTKETKRDWWHLLRHNGMDCEGTRLVALTACREKEQTRALVPEGRRGPS